MLKHKIQFLFIICALLIVVHIINMVSHYQLNAYGIHPRQTHQLWTIFTAPFLPGNLFHLVNNLIGLAIFSALYMVHPLQRYIKSSVLIIIITGVLVWLFGRNATHIGASGWVFGLWSLCIATAWFERRFKNIAVAFLVIVFYGGLIYGVLPRDNGVSFESHLCGVFAGIFCAYFNSKQRSS